MKGLNLKSKKVIADLFGKGFIVIPRGIAVYATSKDPQERALGLVLLGLIFVCYHTDGPREYNSRRFTCKRGEYIGSYRELAGTIGVSRYQVQKILKLLCSHGVIEKKDLPRDGFRITFTEYVKFLESCSATKKKDASEIGLDDLFGDLSGPSEEALRIAGEVKIPPLY